MSLLWLLLIPTIGAVAIAACPRERPRAAKWVFGVAAGLVLLWVAVLVGWFQTSAGAQWTVRLEWLEEPWPVAWELGVDGFNLFFLGLTALFTLLSGIASFDREDDGRGLLGLLLLLEAATLGLFLAQDLISFYIFWDLMLVPPFLLMLGWGGEARRQAAWRYILYNGAGGLALLLSIVAVGAAGHGFQLSALWGGTLEAGGGAA
ncbi:MAG TPA: proton-conducting transporter membrane subunit, partial [Limnochordia bacterium]